MDKYNEFEICSPCGPSYKCGVYGVFVTSGTNTRCVYIGSSKNIFNRVMSESHVYRKLYDRISGFDYLVYTREIICTDYILRERDLIRKYKPLLNKVRYGA
jgi:excinuclease UvrABC nuclease subunit